MIHADLAGKNHVAEDVLTSNCLGLLGLLGPNEFINLFGHAKNPEGETLSLREHQECDVSLKFWPYLQEGGIPDATATISHHAEAPSLLVIEAKHGARQSGGSNDDQLARYWFAGNKLFPNRSVLIYLTHHRAMPKEEIKNSCASVAKAGHAAKIYWISWFTLFKWAEDRLLAGSSRHPVEIRILEALRDYLAAKSYCVFHKWNTHLLESPKQPYLRNYRLGSPNNIKKAFGRDYFRAPVEYVSFVP